MKKLMWYGLFIAATAAAPASQARGVHPEEGAGQSVRVEPAEERELRDPSEFEFGQYHRSSKMEPRGSLEPKSWAETDAVDLPEGARPAPTISEAAGDERAEAAIVPGEEAETHEESGHEDRDGSLSRE